MSMRDILERPSDGKVFDTAQLFTEVYDDSQQRLKVTLQGDSKFSEYETAEITPGDSVDGYDVKVVGGMFSTVTTSTKTILKNNDDVQSITVYFNTDNVSPITIKANAEFEIEGFPVTNIFIDTQSGYNSIIEVILFG